ncbi:MULTISPECIES: DUF6879 family protein [unclassified Streptomyces]|uniref:DUF6879 family protein n=1 Tax=unclassified Streptomyces TaxID=2593676 RepID=UPI003811F455
MRDRSVLTFEEHQGERLLLDQYRRDFRQRDETITGRDSWKFERRQHFEELGSPSWEAFRRGDWSEALRLMAENGTTYWAQVAQEDRARGSVFHRVRIVEEPLTPYLQWELNSLRVQAECGLPIRVVGGDQLKALEATAPLPEIVVLGSQVLYEVVYTEAGLLDGGIRFADSGLIGRWEGFIKELYEDGEDIISYVDRHVAHLPPPRVEGE